MTKTQLFFSLVTVALLGAILFFVLPHNAFGSVNSGDPSITNFTRLAANDFINGGVETIGNRTASLTQATTTVCAIQSPAATSTLQSASILLTVSSTTASSVVLAKATTAFATTTNLNTEAVAANAQATIVASTSPTGGNKDLIFSPSTWLVVGMSGGTGTFSPTGVCTATWTTLN